MNVRTATAVAILATLASLVLAITTPSPPTTTVVLTALTAPGKALLGERLVISGSILLFDENVLNHRVRFCHIGKEHCATAGWGNASGPGHWSGYVGTVSAIEPGEYDLVWTLYEPWGTDSTPGRMTPDRA